MDPKSNQIIRDAREFKRLVKAHRKLRFRKSLEYIDGAIKSVSAQLDKVKSSSRRKKLEGQLIELRRQREKQIEGDKSEDQKEHEDENAKIEAQRLRESASLNLAETGDAAEVQAGVSGEQN